MTSPRFAISTCVGLWMALGSPGASADTAEPDLSGVKGEPVFFVLGMLDEYSGRAFVESGDMIEHFYCSEHVTAYVFRAYVERVAREQSLDSGIETRWRQECLVSFLSPQIATFINHFYVQDARNLPYSQLEARDPALKLAYLAGAYFRYGVDGHFEFANSGEKMKLIARVLEDVGCRDVTMKSREGLPYQNEVFFQPTDEVSRAFERMPGRWALEAADSLVGLATRDEINIYLEAVRVAQLGLLDGCHLAMPCETGRFTSISMVGRGDVPAPTQAWHEALMDFDGHANELRSVRDLAVDSLRVVDKTSSKWEVGWLALSRVGFDRSGSFAIVFVSYRSASTDCGRWAALFLERRKEQWAAVNYSVRNTK